MDDSLSAIAKAIDKHIDGKANKRLVFDVFRCDRHPNDETTYRVQNAILSALLALDTAEDVLSFKGASSLDSPGDDRLTAMRRRRQREEMMRRQRDREDEENGRDASLFTDRYVEYPSARFSSSTAARAYFGCRHPVSEFLFDRELDCDPPGGGDRPTRKRKLSRRMIEAYEDTHGADSKRNPARCETHPDSSHRRNRFDDEEDDETYQPTSSTRRQSLGEFTCSWCDEQSKSFSTASALFMHIKYKHPKVRLPLYQCKFCPANFNFQFCIERHVQMKHAHVETVGSAYRVTPGTDGGDSKTGAGNGGKSTPNRRASLTKSKEQQDDPDYQEEETGDTKNETETAKIKSSGGKCPKCDKSFHSIKYLEEHMAVMHSLRPPKYKCPVCSKAFTWVSNMRQHLRTMHQGAKRKRGTSNTPEKKASKDGDETPVVPGHDATPDLSDQSDDVTPFDSNQNPAYKASMIDDDDPSYDDKTERGGYACKVCSKVFGTLSGRWRHMHNKHNAPKMRPVTKDEEVYYTTADMDIKKGMMVNGKMKLKKMRKRMERESDKKDKQMISDRFNYRCTLCGEKFPYPISLFNHMKHVHNSTSAGIVGTPKDGSNRAKKNLPSAPDGEMPPPLLPHEGIVGDTISSNHINENEEIEKSGSNSVLLPTVSDQTKDLEVDKTRDEIKKATESDSISGSDQNTNDILTDNPALLDYQEEQYEDEDRADTKDSFDSQMNNENDLDKDDDDDGDDIPADSDHIEEFPSSGSSSTNPLATDETESSDSDDLDPNMPQLMCNDDEMQYDFDSPLMLDDSTTQAMKTISDSGGIDEDMDDDSMNNEKQNKSLNPRRPMGTGDKTCGTCGRSYHWAAGLWRHQKTTGHTGTL